MILAIKTDAPDCHMFLLGPNGRATASESWLAERRLAKELLSRAEAFLQKNTSSFDELTGLIVFRGPGSYTGLRIGITFMNSLAYGLAIPLVGEQADDWLAKGFMRLRKKQNDRIVLPEYGGLPHITTPKK